MQGKVYLTCGHTDSIRPISGWPLKVKGETCDAVEGFVRCIEYHHYCLKCYIDALTRYPEDIIFDPWEEDEYFGQT